MAQSKQIDVDQVSKTFHLLSSYNGIVRWAARKGDEIEGSWAGSAIELVQFAEAYADWDFYVQLNPSNRLYGKRCRSEDIAAWEWFVVDLDPTSEKGIHMDYLTASGAQVEKALEAYTGRPCTSVWVFSGRGMQLWFRVGANEYDVDPMNPSGVKHAWDLRGNPQHKVNMVGAEGTTVTEVRSLPLRDAITCAQRYWLSHLAPRVTTDAVTVDPSVSDLPRLMRCPGTYNRKTGAMARFQHPYRVQEDAKVQPNLGYKLLKYTPNDRLMPAVVPGDQLPDGAPWQAALSKINATAAGTITYGATEPGRHRAMSGAARALAEVGLSQVEIYKALVVAGERSRPELLDPVYLERTARDAFVRFSKISLDAGLPL